VAARIARPPPATRIADPPRATRIAGLPGPVLAVRPVLAAPRVLAVRPVLAARLVRMVRTVVPPQAARAVGPLRAVRTASLPRQVPVRRVRPMVLRTTALLGSHPTISLRASLLRPAAGSWAGRIRSGSSGRS
jgi:hypothetical protein